MGHKDRHTTEKITCRRCGTVFEEITRINGRPIEGMGMKHVWEFCTPCLAGKPWTDENEEE